MSKYLQTDDRQEQRGRAEDGPIGMKHKWTDWPNITPQPDVAKSSAKHKKVTTTAKATPTKTTTTQGATKK